MSYASPCQAVAYTRWQITVQEGGAGTQAARRTSTVPVGSSVFWYVTLLKISEFAWHQYAPLAVPPVPGVGEKVMVGVLHRIHPFSLVRSACAGRETLMLERVRVLLLSSRSVSRPLFSIESLARGGDTVEQEERRRGRHRRRQEERR